MLQFIDSLWAFIGAVLAMILLGVIASFSPTLYVTQIGISATSKKARSLMIALMIGVVLGLLLLSILFQFFQLDTLRSIIDSSISALVVSVVFNILLGAAFIIAGFWYINKKPNRIDSEEKSLAKAGYGGLVSLGFFRTFVSISGATATFFASGIISDEQAGFITHLLLTAIFVAAAVAPFLLILVTMKRYPARVEHVLEWLKAQLVRFNYKLIIGATGILVGSAIIIFNVLKAILFQ